MSEYKKSVTSAVGVVAAVFAVLGGNVWRNRVESPVGSNPFLIGNLLASKTSDSDVGEVDFFHEMTKLLKREYVDPITDDEKLAAGAVRGMIGSLGDPGSLYYDKTQFNTFNQARNGQFEGIGAEFALRMDMPSGPEARAGILPNPDESDGGNSPDRPVVVPELVVTAVIPGGSADHAGVKPGDTVSYVNSRWIVDSESIAKFRAAQKAIAANKMSQADYTALHKDLRLKFDTNILPLRARDLMITGDKGTVDVVWKRGSETRHTVLTKGKIAEQPFELSGNEVRRLYFTDGAAKKLEDAVAGKKFISIDLRNNVNGDFEEMRKCLAALAPGGEYGYIASEKEKKAQAITISKGNSSPPKINLIVDKSTGGAAEIFALALKQKGLAKIEGGAMSSDVNVVEVFGLPDGSGYSLVHGRYSASEPKKQARVAKPQEQQQQVASAEPTGGVA